MGGQITGDETYQTKGSGGKGGVNTQKKKPMEGDHRGCMGPMVRERGEGTQQGGEGKEEGRAHNRKGTGFYEREKGSRKLRNCRIELQRERGKEIGGMKGETLICWMYGRANGENENLKGLDLKKGVTS